MICRRHSSLSIAAITMFSIIATAVRQLYLSSLLPRSDTWIKDEAIFCTFPNASQVVYFHVFTTIHQRKQASATT